MAKQSSDTPRPALITLAVLVPLAALILLGWLGARELSRRRREATLDR